MNFKNLPIRVLVGAIAALAFMVLMGALAIGYSGIVFRRIAGRRA